MSALEKILALSQPTTSNAAYDPASELVLAALEDLGELRLLLAADDEPPAKKQGGKKQGGKKPAKGSDADDDADDDDDADEDDDTPPWLKKKKKNKVKASALAEAAVIALSGLAAPEALRSWVERTADGAVALAGSPYGGVPYADPGYLRDGKKRYPLDSDHHVRLSWSHVLQDSNAGAYSPAQLSSIMGKIRTAAQKLGIQVDDKAAAVALSRSSKPAGPPVAMHHGPFHGTHSHGHAVMDVHEHDHSHNGDSEHDRHHGGASSYRDY